jgi:hypothetical protein
MCGVKVFSGNLLGLDEQGVAMRRDGIIPNNSEHSPMLPNTPTLHPLWAEGRSTHRDNTSLWGFNLLCLMPIPLSSSQLFSFFNRILK